jgi:hypothetical protein
MASAIMRHYHMALGRHTAGETEAIAWKAGQATLMGVGLGFISANSKTGLDLGVSTYKVPIDLGIGVLGLAGSLFSPLTKDQNGIMQDMSAVALGIGVFRKTEAYVKAKNAAVHGEIEDVETALDIGTDPIVRAARNL